jgi:peptidoglycan/LPS O-acetylase OafA/YrhL
LRPARLEALTSLRFFAALAVFFHHYGVPGWISPWLQVMASAGYSGVTIFFVLSGFVLAHNYYGGPGAGLAPIGLRAYAVARIARVYPLYLFVLLWTAAPALVAGEPVPRLWQHALALQAWDPSLDVAFAYNSPGWSLSVEFFLYACFPLLLVGLGRVDRSTTALLVAAGVIVAALAGLTLWFSVGPVAALPWEDPGSAHRWLYRSPAPRVGDFALGMLAARLYARLRTRPESVRAGLALAGGGGLAIATLMLWPIHLSCPASLDLSYALPAVALILGLALSAGSVALRWLRAGPLVRLGEASYALYLIQMPFLEWVAPLKSAVSTPAGYVLATALVLVMLCALSLGLHHGVERPLQRALRSRFG